MCGGSSVSQPKASLPNRHQIRNAIRKVARTMRKDSKTMDSYDFTYKVIQLGGWDKLSFKDYYKAEDAVKSAIMASTFFSHQDGVCGSVKLTLRKSAKL